MVKAAIYTVDFYFISIFILRKMNGLVSTTFSLEQTSGFKLERNKDLTFIVIIRNIDWYEKNSVIRFWAISPSHRLIYLILLGHIKKWKCTISRFVFVYFLTYLIMSDATLFKQQLRYHCRRYVSHTPSGWHNMNYEFFASLWSEFVLCFGEQYNHRHTLKEKPETL